MKKNSLILILIAIVMLMISLISPKVVMAREIPSSAKGMVVIEGNSNEILYSYNHEAELPMASTTKIVTAILAI